MYANWSDTLERAIFHSTIPVLSLNLTVRLSGGGGGRWNPGTTNHPFDALGNSDD